MCDPGIRARALPEDLRPAAPPIVPDRAEAPQIAGHRRKAAPPPESTVRPAVALGNSAARARFPLAGPPCPASRRFDDQRVAGRQTSRSLAGKHDPAP